MCVCDIYEKMCVCVCVRVWTWICCHFRISTDSTGYARVPRLCPLFLQPSARWWSWSSGHVPPLWQSNAPSWAPARPRDAAEILEKKRFFFFFLMALNICYVVWKWWGNLKYRWHYHFIIRFFSFLSFDGHNWGISHFQTHRMHWTNPWPTAHGPKKTQGESWWMSCSAPAFDHGCSIRDGGWLPWISSGFAITFPIPLISLRLCRSFWQTGYK